MGGPTTFAHYFDNGVELGDGALFISDDGRYAGCLDVRDSTAVTLFDFAAGRCRSWRDANAGSLLRSTRGAAHPQLTKYLHGADALKFVSAHGLWLAPSCAPAPETLSLDAPGGQHRLTLQAQIDPEQLRELDEPAKYLQQPLYRVQLDGRWLDVQTRSPADICWSSAGDILLVPVAAADDNGSHWLWRAATGGTRITLGWNLGHALASGMITGVREVDAHGVALNLSMGVPSGGGYPQDWLVQRSPASHTYGSYPPRFLDGADEYGRSRFIDIPARSESLCVRLAWHEIANPLAVGTVESISTRGTRAIFRGERVRREPQPFKVQAGQAVADGVFLFHLWSDCGRYLVVQPRTRGAPERFMILDTDTGTTLTTDYQVANLQLHAYERGMLQVQAPIASVPRQYEFGAFEATTRAPSTDAQGVTSAPDDRWLLMRSERFRVDSQRQAITGPLPKWISLEQPPYPNVAFPFVYHSPDRRRWIHLFGARDDFNDEYDRAQSSRYQACAITDGAVCFESLGTAMIWSEDSRYLFLTTRIAPSEPGFDELDWRGFVLDCDTRTVYAPIELGGLVILDRFDASGVRLRRLACDWWREDVETEVVSLPWAKLLAQPLKSLQRHDDVLLGLHAQPRAEWRTWWKVSQQRAAR
jgi:hypothetical protein